MSMPTFTLGQTAVLRVEVRVDEVLTEATGVVCRVREPDGNLIETPAVADGAAGKYKHSHLTTKHGVHDYGFYGGGAGAGAGEDSFLVEHSSVL